MKCFKVLLISFLICLSPYCYADDADVAQLVLILSQLKTQYDRLGDMKDSLDQSVDQLKQQVDELQGNYNMGGTDPNQFVNSWGSDSEDWQKAMSMAGSGGSSSELGQQVLAISGDFPTYQQTSEQFNQADTSKIDQQYFKLQAENALAERAASQLDYDQIQKQIAYQKKLQGEIDTTKNVKEAIDLQNRLQVEHNLIGLELLRQSSLSNQQQALKAQAEVNGSIKNAQFAK